MSALSRERVRGDLRGAPARAWWPVAMAMFTIGWGGNQFTPLLIAYRRNFGYSTADVNVLLGAYVVGLIPGLLVASALSNRYGRRPLLLLGVLSSLVGSVVLAGGEWGGQPVIFVGRVLSGIAVGIAMSVGTAWISELSTPQFDPASDEGSGARRSAISLTVGFALGPGVAGVIAEWSPMPLVVPYVLHALIAVPTLVALVTRGVETRFESGPGSLLHQMSVPKVLHRRFLWVVLPMAPWIFGSAGIAYAIVPQQVDDALGDWGLLFATALTVATLGTGLLVQPIARRLDSTSNARAIVVSMVLMASGVVAAALTAVTGWPLLAVPTAVLLGGAYGIAVVSGLLEIRRIAEPEELAGLSGVYYALAYAGFLLPAILAALARWFSYPSMLAALAALAVGCCVIIASAYSRHLPASSDAGSRGHSEG